jgi:hypothetical protein
MSDRDTLRQQFERLNRDLEVAIRRREEPGTRSENQAVAEALRGVMFSIGEILANTPGDR